MQPLPLRLLRKLKESAAQITCLNIFATSLLTAETDVQVIDGHTPVPTAPGTCSIRSHAIQALNCRPKSRDTLAFLLAPLRKSQLSDGCSLHTGLGVEVDEEMIARYMVPEEVNCHDITAICLQFFSRCRRVYRC